MGRKLDAAGTWHCENGMLRLAKYILQQSAALHESLNNQNDINES